MSLSRGRRRPVDIDNDGAIDFSGVSSAQVVRPTVPPVLLQNAVVGSEVRKQVTKMDEGASLMPKAVDSRFNSYVNRPLPRRRVGFGSATATAFTVSAAASSAPLGGADVPTKVHTAVGSASERNACAESSNRLAALLLDEESQRQEESQRSNREQYEREMHDLWTRGCAVACESAKAPELSKDASVVELRWEGSLLGRFFRDGVPDVEPWDHWALTVPRYSPANAATSVVLNRIYHIVLPQTYYMGYCLRSDEKKPVTLRLPKTREELRVERLERLRRAKEEQDRAKKAAAQQASSSVNALGTMGGTASTQDRLSNRSLRYGLFGDSVLNPLGTDNKVFSQYQERFLNHQRRNHERHVAAIPHQIEKRKRDLQRHAEERPVLRAYRVYPVYSPAQLGKLRNFANDNLLRGFVLWACKCDAIIVLSGGEVAMRHVDRWIMEKMKWESSETRAMCLMTCPLPEASTFSFVGSRQRKASDLSRHKPAEAHAATANDVKREYVYMNFVDSLREVEEFLCSVPTTGPWRDLLHIWRAVLAAGSAIFSYHTTEEMSANAM
ncbi:putative pre mRNA processing factor 3 (PRP3) Protein of unknown function (DUF1115) [Trypanosoma vivax]|nr:hypothetical protein TRVL_02757 [Trypanosoma vivax]KAH8618806.1 putative pre mRNA processing factor 3 (PRP3) Protein of unknown function (DUF1115) [Trypanosoma vivax]